MTGREWTIVLRGDWHLPHLVNMLDAYRGNAEQRSCADDMIAQIREQMVPFEGSTVLKTTRPLLVIDPEDREQAERLTAAHCAHYDHRAPVRPEEVDAMQAALRSLVAPPKPPEPTGLGAVVEDADGDRWVLSRIAAVGLLGVRWENARTLAHRKYANIDAVRILSEGLS
ncbi:MAG TPA: hypothetical protein VJL80_09890 [Aeromicrobium sp.]|nr:hypothetical protein [Aeromicrobium sp.]HKY58337.1 hypothetical protein [Aeromicrobium sp.]